MRIAINAQLLPQNLSGGVGQVVIGLVYGLGKLTDGDEEYLIVSPWEDPEWLKPYMGLNQRIVVGKKPQNSHWTVRRQLFMRGLGPLSKPLRTGWRKILKGYRNTTPLRAPTLPDSNGFFEALDVDAVHFPYQAFEHCNLPTIYCPHDLQHLYLPELWSRSQFAWRETLYRTGCHQSQAVVVESQWIKEDIIKQYNVEKEKIYVIPLGAATEAYENLSLEETIQVQQKFRLPQTFVLYPAQTWPHKNHLRLIEAVALLRDRFKLHVNLICTGGQTDLWPKIADRIAALRLEDQVRFLGFVSPHELRALYNLAQFLIFPTLFEGWGFPMFEAFREETPVACAKVTSLHEYGEGAALFFDPTSIEEIARALQRMATDHELLEELRRRGTQRISLFSWEKTARSFRALYRKTTNQTLTDEDQLLLAEALSCRQGLELAGQR